MLLLIINAAFMFSQGNLLSLRTFSRDLNLLERFTLASKLSHLSLSAFQPENRLLLFFLFCLLSFLRVSPNF